MHWKKIEMTESHEFVECTALCNRLAGSQSLSLKVPPEKRMTSRMERSGIIGTLLLALLMALPADIIGQDRPTAPPLDPWKPLRPLEGTWLGSSEGKTGEAVVERWYEFVMAGRFMHARNKIKYKPQEKNPKGEPHEDWSMFSYDHARGQLILRQFHIEGFVHEYVLDSVSPDGKTLVFISESIENLAPGGRARLTYHFLGDGELEETFETAGANQEFEIFSQARIKRMR